MSQYKNCIMIGKHLLNELFYLLDVLFHLLIIGKTGTSCFMLGLLQDNKNNVLAHLYDL